MVLLIKSSFLSLLAFYFKNVNNFINYKITFTHFYPMYNIYETFPIERVYLFFIYLIF